MNCTSLAPSGLAPGEDLQLALLNNGSRLLFLNGEWDSDSHDGTLWKGVPVLAEGQQARRRVVFTPALLEGFARLTGDRAPVHFDRAHARGLGFSGPIVHGMLVSSIFSEMLGVQLPGPDTVIQRIAFDFLKPVNVGDEVHYTVTVSRVSAAVGAVTLTLVAEAGAELAVRGSATCVGRQPQ